MLSMGDEIGHGQGGNNNVWCQDNPTAWLDWSAADTDLADHVARLIALRRRLVINRWLNEGEALWLDRHGAAMGPAQWDDGDDRAFALHMPGGTPDGGAILLINGGDAAVDFALPPGFWRCVTETPETRALAGFRVEGIGMALLLAASSDE